MSSNSWRADVIFNLTLPGRFRARLAAEPRGMKTFVDSVATLLGVRDRDDLEQTLASVMLELVDARELIFWRAAQREGRPVFVQRVRCGGEPIAATPPALSREAMSAVARLALDNRRDMAAIEHEGRKGHHAFPVLDGDKPVGVVEIFRSPPLSRAASTVVEGLLRIYRSHLGILDQNQTDELTGLSNRKPFEEAFRRLSQAGRAPPPPVRGELAIVDIDHFKRINDSFGHVYGDEVLVLIASLLKRSFREDDRVFRFGGEEFAILLAGATPAQAERALERFRVEVANFAFPQVGRSTVSLGVTTIRPDETGLEAFGRADQALYMAKRGGRNRLLRYENLLAEGVLARQRGGAEEIELF